MYEYTTDTLQKSGADNVKSGKLMKLEKLEEK
jgi:hypothetical protein